MGKIMVKNQYGKEIDMTAAGLDQEIADSIDADTDQEWFEKYCEAHLAKYGEELEANKQNGQW